MSKVFISPEAARDLSQIKQYISVELNNPGAAKRIVQSIMRELRALEHYPKQGPSIEALTGFETDMRMLLCGKHIALYKIKNETVFIARVLDARQDYLKVLFGNDYWEGTEDVENRVKAAKSLFGILPDTPASYAVDQPNRETIAAIREAERVAKDPSEKGYSDT